VPCGKLVDKIGKFSTGCGMLKSFPQRGSVFHRVFHRVFHKNQGVFHRLNEHFVFLYIKINLGFDRASSKC
jgi:hypothetical protein